MQQSALFVLSWFTAAEPPPPPPPPPSPPSVHAKLALSSQHFVLLSAACAGLALLALLLTWVRLRRAARASKAPRLLVKVEASDAAAGRVAVLNCPSGAESPLAAHVCRLLAQRGYAEVRRVTAPGDASLDAACAGAQLAVDLALDAGASAPAGTEALLRACAKHGIGAVVLCSDALVGYDPSVDVSDGDELADPGLSLISPEPRPPAPATGRLLALRQSEEALGRYHAAGLVSGAIVLRMHRVYAADLSGFPAALGVALAAGGLAGGGTRAQTTLLHAEDAAYSVTLAADKLAEAGFAALETVVVTDPKVWSVNHLLCCAARALHLPAPLALPFAVVPFRLLGGAAAAVGARGAAAALHAASTHCYFTATKAERFLGFAPRAGAKGLHAALCAVGARAGAAPRLVPALQAFAVFFAADAMSKPALAAPALVLATAALLHALLIGAPKKLPAQPPLPPPLVTGGVPVLGHLLDFIKGPVGMIDGLRAKHRSMFTIRVGPQRITFMIGECPPTSTATATVDATALTTTTPHLQVPSRSFSSSSRRTRCSTKRPCTASRSPSSAKASSTTRRSTSASSR